MFVRLFLSLLLSSPCLSASVFKLCPIVFCFFLYVLSVSHSPSSNHPISRLPVYLFVSPRAFPSLSHVPTLARPHRSLSVTSQTPLASGLHAASTARHQDRRGPITNPSISHWSTSPSVPVTLCGLNMHGVLTRVTDGM